MPTTDERREVAARLRSVEADAYSCCETYYDALRDAVGCGYGQDRQYMDFGERLADLIEPEERTCEMYRDEEGNWHCRSCEDGSDKITGSDGTLDSWCDSWHPNYCPNCGAKVVDE